MRGEHGGAHVQHREQVRGPAGVGPAVVAIAAAASVSAAPTVWTDSRLLGGEVRCEVAAK